MNPEVGGSLEMCLPTVVRVSVVRTGDHPETVGFGNRWGVGQCTHIWSYSGMPNGLTW